MMVGHFTANAITRSLSIWLILVVSPGLAGCHVFNFFGERQQENDPETATVTGPVLGQPIREQAGSSDPSALDAIYQIPTADAPASIRPDPDMYVRRLLLQHHGEGATTARLIGSVEAFRPLAGGASVDFSTLPQESYDATSLLTTAEMATTLCRALVAPNRQEHDIWQTILPASPGEKEANIRHLAQRFLGIPSTSISDEKMALLQNILDLEAAGTPLTHQHYVPVCVALALDARSLFL